MSDAPKWDGVPTEEELRVMFRDPRYWRTRDPAFVKRVTDGFKALAKSQEARPAHTPSAWQAGWAAGREAAAEVVGAVRDWDGQDYYCDSCKGGAVYPDAEQVAASIRALPVPPPPHGEVG